MKKLLVYFVDIGWFVFFMIALYVVTGSGALVLFASLWYASHIIGSITLREGWE